MISETLEATTENISERITLIGPKVEELSKKIEVRLVSSGMHDLQLHLKLNSSLKE